MRVARRCTMSKQQVPSPSRECVECVILVVAVVVLVDVRALT